MQIYFSIVARDIINLSMGNSVVKNPLAMQETWV